MSGKTSSGKEYKKVQESSRGSEMAETVELAGMLKALLEDRKVLETEIQEERKRRDEEAARREEEMRQQMELIRGLVEERRGGHEEGAERRPPDVKVPVAKLTDLSAYF